MAACLTLADAPLRTPLTLVDATAPEHTRRRLSALGLRRGVTLVLLQATTGGGRIASVAGSRIALGRDLLGSLVAEPGLR